MRFVIIVLTILASCFVYSQEKFLEINQVYLNSEGKKIKNYEVSISTSEGITFVLKAKKKLNYYLPPGEYYTLIVSKDNLPKQNIIIDLLDVPENRYDAKLQLELISSLINKEEMKFHYEERYGKVVQKL
ncbi:MAG: hypothetical protein ACPGU5_03860 [Lishizhenia sp.]